MKNGGSFHCKLLVHQRVPKNRWSIIKINGKSLVKMDDLGVPHDLGVTPKKNLLSSYVKLFHINMCGKCGEKCGSYGEYPPINLDSYISIISLLIVRDIFHVASRVLRRCQMQIPWHLHQGIFLFGPGQKVVEGLAAGDVIRVPVQPEGHHPIPGNWWNMLGTSEVTTSEASKMYL